MRKTVVVPILLGAVLLSGSPGSAKDLRDLIRGLYGGDGIFVATDPRANHTAHFSIGSAASINRLNELLAAQLGVFPFSSSVGGFTFAFEKELGTFVRTTETLGPLFAERAPTLGQGKLNLHASYTFFEYDKFAGKSLDGLQVVARHDPNVIGFPDVREQFERDILLIDLDLDIRVQIFALAATYGITDRLDAGILLPITSIDMDVRSRARIVQSPQNTLFPGVHTFVGGPESPDDQAFESATGVGDIVLRTKYHLLKRNELDLAAAVLAKLNTGDEKNFLGTGTTTLRPFLVASRTFAGWFTPHLNAGYEFDLDRDERSSVEYAVGFDVGTQRLSVAGDVLGSHRPDGTGIGDNIVTGSLGVKWNPWKQLLLLLNLQVPLNQESGLRSKLITTFGVEYSF
ncbi:MAG: transporter [Candidatus Rokubacteria bacterium]|nr:transporter [Candidatus Rokubacteria bacterium]